MIEQWLVEDWRNFTHWWSVRMTLVGAIISGALTAMPSMPPEIQALVPVPYRIAAIGLWCIAAVFTRVARQPSAK